MSSIDPIRSRPDQEHLEGARPRCLVTDLAVPSTGRGKHVERNRGRYKASRQLRASPVASVKPFAEQLGPDY